MRNNTKNPSALIKQKPTQGIPLIDTAFDTLWNANLKMKVNGDAMYPQFSSGDMIFCKKITDYSIIMYGETYFVITDSKRRVLRSVHPHETDESKLILEAENKNYDDLEIDRNEILELYHVKARLSILAL